MTKPEAIVDAQKYANEIQAIVFIYRRGDVYKTSRVESLKGWKVADAVAPEKK